MSSYPIASKDGPQTLVNLRNVTKVTLTKKAVDVCYTSHPMFGLFVLGSGSLDSKTCDTFRWDTEEEAKTHFEAIQARMDRR